MSSKGDPLSVIQAPLEVSALYEVTNMLRHGALPGISCAFNKVVHVGHSFGSALSFGLVSAYPNVSDGIILTGFSMNSSSIFPTVAGFDLKLARLNQPLRFGNVSFSVVNELLSMIGNVSPTEITSLLGDLNVTLAEIQSVVKSTDLLDFISGVDPSSMPHAQDLPTGYVTWSDSGNNQFDFLLPGFFDPSILTFAESTKQPTTLGELLTLASGPKMAPMFEGLVQVVTGSKSCNFARTDISLTLYRRRRDLLRQRLSGNRYSCLSIDSSCDQASYPCSTCI